MHFEWNPNPSHSQQSATDWQNNRRPARAAAPSRHRSIASRTHDADAPESPDAHSRAAFASHPNGPDVGLRSRIAFASAATMAVRLRRQTQWPPVARHQAAGPCAASAGRCCAARPHSVVAPPEPFGSTASLAAACRAAANSCPADAASARSSSGAADGGAGAACACAVAAPVFWVECAAPLQRNGRTCRRHLDRESGHRADGRVVPAG